MKKRILLIGGASAEFHLPVSSFAEDGREVSSSEPYTFLPGGALSLAGRTVTALGGEVILCGCVGKDDFGKGLLDFYQSVGMDTRFLRVCADSSTDVCICMEDADGTRRTQRTNACIGKIDEDLIEEAFTALPDAVYIDMETPAPAAARAAALAREQKIPSFLDGERIPEDFPLETLGVVDVISLSTRTAKALTGVDPRDAQSNLRAAVTLSERLKAKTYLFRYGVGGAFAYKGNFSYFIPDTENADPRLNALAVPAMILENLRSAKSVRATRYAEAVIELAAKKGGEPLAAIPTETELLRYVLENEIEF